MRLVVRKKEIKGGDENDESQRICEIELNVL